MHVAEKHPLQVLTYKAGNHKRSSLRVKNSRTNDIDFCIVPNIGTAEPVVPLLQSGFTRRCHQRGFLTSATEVAAQRMFLLVLRQIFASQVADYFK